ncbi:MAG: RNA-binding cell elongation regulator Jag/EloR [Clostridia bacterium]|nr:RNA-binding cell elongation regulator Jag/EloR [Clostridia bacterium]
MIHEQIATAETIEEAQKMAVNALNAPITEEIKIEVLEMPKKKTFGLFGGAPAKVRAYYETEDVNEKEVSTATFDREKKPNNKKVNRTDKKQNKKTKEVFSATEKTEIKKQDVPKEVAETYDYFEKIIVMMGVSEPNIKILKREENEYYFNIDNEEYHSFIIGRRGETVDALQYLLRLKSSNISRMQDDDKFKIYLNVGDYRQRRENTLIDLAKRSASKAKRYNRKIILNPMNPYDRRIIHTTVSEIDGVDSHSVGHRSQRKVVITPQNNMGEEKVESPKVKSADLPKSKYESNETSLYGKIDI